MCTYIIYGNVIACVYMILVFDVGEDNYSDSNFNWNVQPMLRVDQGKPG